jgi:integration host factor subunit beta
MTRSELMARLAERVPDLSVPQVERAVKHLLDLLGDGLASGERIEVRGFGAFRLNHYASRLGRNPRTGEAVALPPRAAVRFKPGIELRERVLASAKGEAG